MYSIEGRLLAFAFALATAIIRFFIVELFARYVFLSPLLFLELIRSTPLAEPLHTPQTIVYETEHNMLSVEIVHPLLIRGSPLFVMVSINSVLILFMPSLLWTPRLPYFNFNFIAFHPFSARVMSRY